MISHRIQFYSEEEVIKPVVAQGFGVPSCMMTNLLTEEVGFRCVIPLREENYFEKQYGRNVPNFP